MTAAPQQPASMEWKLVPTKSIVDILSLLPPPAAVIEDNVYAYQAPNANERLHKIRRLFDALLAASPPPAQSDEIKRLQKAEAALTASQAEAARLREALDQWTEYSDKLESVLEFVAGQSADQLKRMHASEGLKLVRPALQSSEGAAAPAAPPSPGAR